MMPPVTRLALALVLSAAPQVAQSQDASRPNIVLIITDDVGYGDIGSYGARDVRTPNIDRLARQGTRFTDFYAMPQCTPTRAALITGRYQQRVRLERALSTTPAHLELGLPVTGRSLPQLLKNHGYATGLVGKWHLGFRPANSPNAHGFDYFFGFLAGYVDFYHHTRGFDGARDLWENAEPARDSGYITDLLTARAVQFMERSARAPFFLEVAYNAAHWPFQRPDSPSRSANSGAFQGPADSVPATRADYVAMLERADRGVGEILATLERLGIAGNTLVIFTNDNGGEWLSSNAPLFHRKDTLWEGGIRVPLIMRWPGRVPAGTTATTPGITMDITRTILAAAGAPVPDDARLEGVDLVPIARARPSTDRALFWRIANAGRQQRAVRRGDWKLLLDADDLLLFDVRGDVGERFDRAASRPALVRELLALVRAWERDVDAEAAALVNADSLSVVAFYGQWFGSMRQGPERYASFYAEDGMVLPPGLPPAVGRAAIAAWLSDAQANAPYTTRPTGITVDEMRFLSPTLVLHRSTLKGDRIPKAGGGGTPFETKYVDVLRRDGDGRWLVVSRMWSDNR